MTGWQARSLAAILLAGLVVVAGSVQATVAKGDRSLVTAAQLRDRPFRGIVLVSIRGGVVCSGSIVAPRKVVTAAHCLTRDAARRDFRFRKGLPGNLRLYRAYSSAAGGSRFASCGVKKAWAHPRFIKRNDRDRRFGSRAHDFAVLTTERACKYPRKAINRLWATSESEGKLRTGQRIKLGGYPADPRVADMNGLNMWRTKGEVRPPGYDDRLLGVTGFVAQGMSGGPIWRSFGKRPSPCGRKQCVVGIITECAVNTNGLCRMGSSERRAVRITPDVKRAIKKH